MATAIVGFLAMVLGVKLFRAGLGLLSAVIEADIARKEQE